MCFGSSQVSSSTSTPTPNAAVGGAATGALTSAENLQSAGFTPYSGNQVANFGPLQSQSFNGANSWGANAPNYLSQAGDLFGVAGTTQLPTVNASTINSAMSPYLNQYVNYALAPQIQGQNQQFAAQDKALNAQATSSGAFGDARAGIEAANLTNQQDLSRTGLIGTAYNNAFNTAIGAGAQDVSNNLQAQTTNAGLAQSQIANMMAAGSGFQGLGQSGLTTENAFGQQQTAQSQAGLNAAYNQWLMGQQYPFQTQQLLNSTIGAASQAMPASTTTTQQQPNNSGYAMLGAMFPALFNGGSGGFSQSAMGMGANFMMSDERVKTDKTKIGKTDDGQNLYAYRYHWDEPGTKRIGLMAQEVEKVKPDAVLTVWDTKFVNYDRALGLDNIFGVAA